MGLGLGRSVRVGPAWAEFLGGDEVLGVAGWVLDKDEVLGGAGWVLDEDEV